MAPHRTFSREKDFSRVIVSGGEDCTIRVWQLDTGEELHTWRQHSDGISELLPLPEIADGSGKSVFLSISKDLSVGLFSLQTLHCLQMYVNQIHAVSRFTCKRKYSFIHSFIHSFRFPGHPAPITEVRLRLDQDYLLVQCEDTSVSVWEMSTGQLEGCIWYYSYHTYLRRQACAIQIQLTRGGLLSVQRQGGSRDHRDCCRLDELAIAVSQDHP